MKRLLVIAIALIVGSMPGTNTVSQTTACVWALQPWEFDEQYQNNWFGPPTPILVAGEVIQCVDNGSGGGCMGCAAYWLFSVTYDSAGNLMFTLVNSSAKQKLDACGSDIDAAAFYIPVYYDGMYVIFTEFANCNTGAIYTTGEGWFSISEGQFQ